SRDGKQLATGEGKNVRIFDVTNGQEQLKLEGHTIQLGALAFSPDGKRLVTIAVDANPFHRVHEAKLWDLQTGKSITDLQGHTDLAVTAAYAPDGKHFVTAG